ncbi:hypothetical protein KTQ42_21380 [Noviherbaspirillum sp. L7-7A]|uniref:hypothetical protein n=1 Tax=Noviherbaspirillum sp. L7-7A TaxID=2850560 RepID=UPI001C2C0D7C|nr:hypothetical protein [Noviherbaspirillum sp. L7-7A]MBV0881835.1 hypothetical protein [Noviherbaspirillum sp. L7-7A]
MLDLPGLRHRKLGRYADLVFYVEWEDYIEVWQILHARMNVLNRLRDPDSPGAADENGG